MNGVRWAAEVAQPLTKTEKTVMISSGNGDSAGFGASRIRGGVTEIIAQLPGVLEALTGVDVLATPKSLPGVKLTEGQKGEQPGGETPGSGG